MIILNRDNIFVVNFGSFAASLISRLSTLAENLAIATIEFQINPTRLTLQKSCINNQQLDRISRYFLETPLNRDCTHRRSRRALNLSNTPRIIKAPEPTLLEYPISTTSPLHSNHLTTTQTRHILQTSNNRQKG